MTITSESALRLGGGVSRARAKPLAPPQHLEVVDILERVIAAEPTARTACALIIVNIEQYRDLAIEIGHGGAESLVHEIAARISDCLRPVDLISRLGTSELALVLPGLRNSAQSLMAVRRIERACEDKVMIDGKSIKPRLHCGAAVLPNDAITAAEMLVCAETALRHAIKHRSHSVFYSDLNKINVLPVVDLERNLRLAIENNELASVYQPIIATNTGDLISVEMLTRWTCPKLGPVRPDIFIEVAEHTGLISPLTFWGFNKGLRECMEWQSALPNLAVSINLSPAVLCEPHLFEWLSQTLKVWGADPSRLTVEITEQSLLLDPEVSLAVLHKLHAQGIRIAIDDFGTGHSTLSYLRKLPISALKIDKSFVTGMLANPADLRIVKSVIDLAHNFNLGVVAEGVEDEETLDALTLMGCQCAQGWFVSRPMAAEALPGWLATSPWTLPRTRHAPVAVPK